jgi:hypothetical protein
MATYAILMPAHGAKTKFDATLRIAANYVIEHVQSAFNVMTRDVSIVY